MRDSAIRAATCGFLLLILGAAPAHGRPADADLVVLPPTFRADGISPDGTVFGWDARLGVAAIWRNGRIAPIAKDPGEVLPHTLLLAASRRARVVVPLFNPAVVWRRGRVHTLAPDGEARDVSADGRVVVGFVHDPVHFRVAMRWVDGVGEAIAADGLEALWARSVSADGRAVVGDGLFDGGPYSRFLWRDGEAIEIAGLPHATRDAGYIADFGFESLLISGDATTVTHRDLVGDERCSENCGRVVEAWRWRDGEIESLGWLHPEDGHAQPQGITGNGFVIVGTTWAPFRGNEAFLWDRAHGMRRLGELLQDLGADLQGFEIVGAREISDDGRRIVGHLRDSANPHATATYLAILPPACADRIDNDGDGRVDFPEDDGCRRPRDNRE